MAGIGEVERLEAQVGRFGKKVPLEKIFLGKTIRAFAE
jgi:hypothetical protein